MNKQQQPEPKGNPALATKVKYLSTRFLRKNMQGNGTPDHIPIWATSFTPALLLLISDLVHSYTGTNCASFSLAVTS
jgi:hypothetical protein